jgi:hypothetical protein
MGWVTKATRGKNTDFHCKGGLVGLCQYERVWKKKSGSYRHLNSRPSKPYSAVMPITISQPHFNERKKAVKGQKFCRQRHDIWMFRTKSLLVWTRMQNLSSSYWCTRMNIELIAWRLTNTLMHLTRGRPGAWEKDLVHFIINGSIN